MDPKDQETQEALVELGEMLDAIASDHSDEENAEMGCLSCS